MAFPAKFSNFSIQQERKAMATADNCITSFMDPPSNNCDLAAMGEYDIMRDLLGLQQQDDSQKNISLTQFFPSDLCQPQQPFLQVPSPVTPLPQQSSCFHSQKRKEPETGLACPTPSKRPINFSNFDPALSAKLEPCFSVEPLTPSASSRGILPLSNKTVSALPRASLTHPLSPISHSVCSDDEDFTQEYSPVSPLPTPCKFVAARRRAQRRHALKRSRARAGSKEESPVVVPGSDLDSTLPPSASLDEDEGDCRLLDKKTARAIRNRQAAQRSRIEAKAKMQKLAEDNDDLAVTVENLKRENTELSRQLQALMSHVFGSGQDVDNVLTVFNRVKNSETNVNML